MEKTRYFHHKLLEQPNQNGLQITRDNNGNRLFLSRVHHYEDKVNGLKPTALLLSPRGERMMKIYPHLLTTLDDLLKNSHNNPQQVSEGGIIMENYKFGGQSMTRKVTMPTKAAETLIIKVPRGRAKCTQSYMHEMQQTHALDHALKPELEKAGIELSSFYFASPFVSATQFVEGSEPSREQVLQRTRTLYKRVREFIAGQNDNPLWRNIHLDGKDWLTGKYLTRNFVLRKDNTLVWVDPFTYSEKKPKPFLENILPHIIFHRE